jgi:ABC-2 type transport system ATP-binding protein
MNDIITVENATKRFKDKAVFQNVSLQMESGNSYGFIGYNGCGKSVLLKSICGFSRLSSGKITLSGKIIGKDIDFIENAGVIIETPAFMEHLSGMENLLMIAQIRKIIDKPRIEETLKLLGLFEDRNKAVKKYSLGMKQKLRIAQAIMENPKILILDEPTNGLDKDSVMLLRDYLVNFVKNGGLLILTSHNKEDIEICCENIYEFDKGNLIGKT